MPAHGYHAVLRDERVARDGVDVHVVVECDLRDPEVWSFSGGFGIEIPGVPSVATVDFAFEVPELARRGLRTRVRCLRAVPGRPIAALTRPAAPRDSRPRVAGLDADGGFAGLRGGWATDVAPPEVVEHAGIDWLVVDSSAVMAGWEAIVTDGDRLAMTVDLVRALAAWPAG